MRNISTFLLDELEKDHYAFALIINLGGYGNLTSWGTQIDTAIPRGMNPGKIKYGTSNIIDSFTCSFDDTDKALYLAHKFSSTGKMEVKEYPISVIIAVINPDTSIIIGQTEVFNGFYSEWDYSPQHFSIRAISSLDKFKYPTNRISSSSCLVKQFKDWQCQYSGTATYCDRNFKTCHDYGNDANFRGFKWLPTLVNKQIRFST